MVWRLWSRWFRRPAFRRFRGGKPKPNSSTLMPKRLAVRKWPSSWTKTRNARTGIMSSQEGSPNTSVTPRVPLRGRWPRPRRLVCPRDRGHDAGSWESRAARMILCMSRKPILRSRKACTAASLAPLRAAGHVPPRLANSIAMSKQGYLSGSHSWKVRAAEAMGSKRLMAGFSMRWGYASAYWMGRRISGGLIWALTEPSATRPWSG